MKTQLLILASLLAVVGIVVVLLIEPEVSPRVIELKGLVKGVRETGKVTFIEMVPQEISIVSFDPVDLEPGEHTMRGHLQEYKGRVEFVVDGYD